MSALLASAALTTLHASSASAFDHADPRLAVIDQALSSRRRLIRDAVRCAATLQPAATPSDLERFLLSIPAATIRDVASALERATGIAITLANASIGDISSPGISGTFTLQQALQPMLDGTNVMFRTNSRGVVLDIPGLSESVSVSGTIVRTVESPQYQAPLRDIPQTLDVIPRAAMDAQGATTLSEALRNVPGITMPAKIVKRLGPCSTTAPPGNSTTRKRLRSTTTGTCGLAR